MNKNKKLYRNIGIVGIFLTILIVFWFDSIFLVILNFAQRNFSSDGKFESQNTFLLKMIFLTSLLILLIFSLFTFFGLWQRVKDLSDFLFDYDKNRLISYFCKEPLSSISYLSLFTFVFGTLHVIILYLDYAINFTHSVEFTPSEGWLEHYSTFLLLISIIFLLIATVKMKNLNIAGRLKRNSIFSLLLLSLVLFFLFGEEISWGQRIFGWKSTGIFEDYNYQQETNLHNFLNPFMRYLYPVTGMGLFVFLVSIWFFTNDNKHYLAKLILPHPSLFFVAFMMACSTYDGHSEVFEALLYVFFLLYSIRLLIILSFPNSEYLDYYKTDKKKIES